MTHELAPGLTVQLDREHVVGLISEEGTNTSHAAILAHSLGIPAVMGPAARSTNRTGAMLLLDGQSGTVLSSRPAPSWRTPGAAEPAPALRDAARSGAGPNPP